MNKNYRYDPDKLLKTITDFEAKAKRGKLKIFFGACPGVGKTYMMLLDSKQHVEEGGIDLVAGIIETHGRKDTAKLLSTIPQIPTKTIKYRNIKLQELDIDAILKRKPQIVLVDELAHTNAPGSRHPKRWNDVEEILNAGIDVHTTLNVQHLESLNDLVESITGVNVKETVPDSIFDKADDIVLVDIIADELLARLRKGKVYLNDKVKANAADNFFKKENIIALRELALRRTAQRVDAQMEDYAVRQGIGEVQGLAKKIMVCIGPNSLSDKLIRSTKRMAVSLKVPWIICYVENSRHYRLSEREKTLVESYFRMAKRNGAETAILYGENAVEEILSYARSKNINKIVVGKSKKSRLRDIIQGSLAEKIIRRSGAIDVYVITGDVEEEISERKGFQLRKIDFGHYGNALAAVIACTIFGKIFDKYFEPIDQIMVYLAGAVLVAARFGRVSSILFCIFSVTAFNFFFISPYYSFNVINSSYWLTFLVMLLTSLFIATQAARLRWQAAISRKREKDTSRFYDLSRSLSSTRGHQNIADISAQQISEIFNCEVVIWMIREDSAEPIEIVSNNSAPEAQSTKEKAVIMWCLKNGQMAGRETDTMPSSIGLYLPLMVLNKNIGVVGIFPKDLKRKITTEEKSSLEIFANLIASSLERANMSSEAETVKIKAETEKLRNILLSSVSHDLRTPLASIIGASESIFNDFKNLKKDSIINLAQSIHGEASRLSKIVKNLLDITSIESGNLKLNKQPYYIQEIIGSAILRMENELKNHKIKVDCAKDLPMVAIDGVLIEQVITNLLENAAKYTKKGSLIEIIAKNELDNLAVEIKDNGGGIKDYTAGGKNKKGGYGLGLIICSGILKAHNSSLKITNLVSGGAYFSFILPEIIATNNNHDE